MYWRSFFKMGIISKTAKVKWLNCNKEYYMSQGYNFTKLNSYFDCAVEDLRDGASAIIEIQCDFCGKTYNLPYKTFQKHKSEVCCCKECLKYKKKVKDKNGKVHFIDAPYRNREWLYDQYIVKGKSANKIAEEFGINVRTLREWITKFEIALKREALDIPYEDLYDMYVIQKQTTEEIGCYYNISSTTILNRLEKYNIARRHADEYMPYWYNCKGGRQKMFSINGDINRRIQISCCQRKINIEDFDGFLKSESALARSSSAYKLWRSTVFERDDYTCQKCGKHGGDLQAHHIENFRDNLNLRYDINNGVTLCKQCHTPGYDGSFHSIYGCFNNNRQQLEEFISDYVIADLDEEIDELYL